jgi:hypothetical protein
MVTSDASYRWSNAFTTTIGTSSSQPGASSEGTREGVTAARQSGSAV